MPQDICYGIVNALATNFGHALTQAGVIVDFFDIKKECAENLIYHMHKHYTAVIDFYSGLLLVTMQSSGNYFWNYVDAPIYQILLDYPLYIADKLNSKLHNCYALCLDRHYCDLLNNFIPGFIDSYFFPMAGVEGKNRIPWKDRLYDLVFIGSYSNYREWLIELEMCEPGIRQIGYAFFLMMRDHPNLDQRQAFESTLAQLNIHISKKEALQWMQMLGGLAMSAAAYHREQLIDILLRSDLKIEVYGESWKNCPFAKQPNLIIHPQINEEAYISILEQTKISLNIMYSNKAAYTERYAYSMLNGAICVSDLSEYLSEAFTNEEDIIFYELNCLQTLPPKIKWLLNNPEIAQRISDSAYYKAKKEHTWTERAAQFLKLL